MKLAWSLPALDRLDEGQLETVWRLAGGHPRSLEYLDALLSGGTARYPDVTARLDAAITRRLDGGDRDRWLAARTGLDAALAETVALAADDVLLDDLLTRLDAVSGAAALLTGVPVYREPVDFNAVLFTAGQPDPAAEDIPDGAAAYQRIAEILAAAGIPVDGPVDLASVPVDVRAELAPYLAELNRRSAPPFRPGPGLAGQVGACQAAGLMAVSGTGLGQRFFVHRWTATELAARQAGEQLAAAHRQAAAYWRWRYQAWPQDQAADMHDLLEARHHLLAAGDTDAATQITWPICTQLHTWGAWDQEAALIHDTLVRLPDRSADQARWLRQLGMVADRRGDYDQAERQYQRALDISERLGDQAGMALSYHRLGILAGHRGDYDQAERQYQRALDIKEQLGDPAGMADGYHQLGILAHRRGDYDQAERQYQRALDTFERLGDPAGMAASYGQLGILAQDRKDYDQAERQYQRALDTFERLGDPASMAASISQLGILEAERGAPPAAVIIRHVRALAIRLRLGIPQAMIDLRRLAACRDDLGQEQFTALLTQATGDTGQAQTIMSLLDQLDAAATPGQRGQAEEPSR